MIIVVPFLFHYDSIPVDSNQLAKTSLIWKGCWNQNIELSLDNYLVLITIDIFI